VVPNYKEGTIPIGLVANTLTWQPIPTTWRWKMIFCTYLCHRRNKNRVCCCRIVTQHRRRPWPSSTLLVIGVLGNSIESMKNNRKKFEWERGRAVLALGPLQNSTTRDLSQYTVSQTLDHESPFSIPVEPLEQQPPVFNIKCIE
jgi:hypothetical protein